MIPSAVRAGVRRRARDRCEYCKLPQSAEPHVRFHIEHITARQHGGEDVPENLALSCHRCNRRKGPNLTVIDPLTGQLVKLFHPRHDRWRTHFRRSGPRIVGLTAAGRASVELLQMNALVRIELRHWWSKGGSSES